MIAEESRHGDQISCQGQDTAVVTRVGLACSEQILAGYEARMNRSDDNAIPPPQRAVRASSRHSLGKMRRFGRRWNAETRNRENLTFGTLPFVDEAGDNEQDEEIPR